jgi:hypothetical protein
VCYEFFSSHIKSNKAKLDSGQVIEELGADFQQGKIETQSKKNLEYLAYI